MANNNLIQVRRGYSSNYSGPPIDGRLAAQKWAANSTLAEGEIGYEIDTGKFKIGRLHLVEGTWIKMPWSLLPYAGAGEINPASGISVVYSDTSPDLVYSFINPDDNNVTATLKNITGLIPNATGTYYSIGLADDLNISGHITSSGINLTETIRKLSPASPPEIPAGQTLSSVSPVLANRILCSGYSSAPTNGNSVTLTPNTVYQTAFVNSYQTNVIQNVGPATAGTVVTVTKNTNDEGSKTLTDGSDDGSYGDLIISNNVDYNSVNSDIPAGFWDVFSAKAQGTASVGWNTVKISSSPGGETNLLGWYYDSNTQAPVVNSVVVSSGTGGQLVYSSSVPHYSGSFNISFNVQYLSGDTYRSDFIANSTAGTIHAINDIGAISRTTAGLPEALSRNYASTPVAATMSNIVTTKSSSFKSVSSSNFMPALTLYNSASSATFSPTIGTTSLIKTISGPTAGVLQEDNIPVTIVDGVNTSYGSRISGYGTGDTPVAGTITSWNSSSGLGQYDAAVVAGTLKHDLTNYSTYFPAGPNLGLSPRGSGSAQYFTFKITRDSVSRLRINIGSSTGIAGLWFRLPGTAMDSALSSTNGWANANIQYTQIFNSSNTGCAEATVVPLAPSVLSIGTAYTITFGTSNSSQTSPVPDEIHVRIKLNNGQSISSLLIQGAA